MFDDVSDITDSNLLTANIFGRINDPFEVIGAGTHVAGLDLASTVVDATGL